jgi:hypothetical protein
MGSASRYAADRVKSLSRDLMATDDNVEGKKMGAE